MATTRRADMFTADGKPSDDDPRDRPAARLRRDRLRTDRVPLCLTPPRLVIAEPSTELGHLRSPRHPVVRLPAVRSLELFLGGHLTHVDIVCRRWRTQARLRGPLLPSSP